MFNIILEVLVFLVVCSLENTEGRDYTQTLSVSNGGSWGDWGPVDFCANGSYAYGYFLRIEANQGPGDDTALNGIGIVCKSRDGLEYRYASSEMGPWGYWVEHTLCPGSEVLVAFSLQVEENQGSGDDSAANFVKFKCHSFDGSGQISELAAPPGSGLWGSYGSYSQFCPLGSAICGIQTRVEEKQYSDDDTALNDVKFYCCT